MKNVIKSYEFNEKKFYFYDEKSQKTIEEIYKMPQKMKKYDIEYVLYDNYSYPFPNPHTVKIILPDLEEKNVFVAGSLDLYTIIGLFPNCLAYIKEEGDKDFTKTNQIHHNKKYSEIKFISKYEDITEYDKANSIYGVSESFPLSELSPVYKEYLDNGKYILETKPTFNPTEERKKFFNLLAKKLDVSHVISFCGPEGIGKSASILAFFKVYIRLYFYSNLKKLMECFDNNDTDKAQELILRELYHSITFIKFKDKLPELLALFREKNHPLDLIKRIIEILDFKNVCIVIDQYKVIYDIDYHKLKKLIEISNNHNNKIIVVSSMNEIDVKDSIISIFQQTDVSKKFILDYIYVTSLITCVEKDLKKLNSQEKQLLSKYGSTYNSYYKILEEKINFSKQNKYDNFEDYFDNKMFDYFQNRLKEYYNIKEDNTVLFEKIEYLLLLSDKGISIKDFLNNAKKIPFRFFKFIYENNNVFNISSIKLEDHITLSFQCEKYISFLIQLRKNLISKDSEQFYSSNFDSEKEAIKLEESFTLLLWASRKSNNKIIEGMNITKKITVKNLFSLSPEDIAFDKLQLKKGEGVLLTFEYQNALAFDCAVLKLENQQKGIYSLYLFQVTRSKKPNERLTYISLNDYSNFFIIYFKSIFKSISIEKVYFSYIFDMDKPDNPTINECEANKIDYALFDKKLLNLDRSLKLTEYLPKIKIFDPAQKYRQLEWKNFSPIKKTKEGEIRNTALYLNKKRKLIQEMNIVENHLKQKYANQKKRIKEKKKTKNQKDISYNLDISKDIEINENIQEASKITGKTKEELNEYKEIKEKISELRDYLNKVNKVSFKKENEIFTTYEQRERIISDYLIMKEKEKIPGISYDIENQKLYIDTLIGEGFSDKQIKNLFGLILKTQNDFIIELNKIGSQNFCQDINYPEFKTFIFAKREDHAFFIDYLNNETINLLNKEKYASLSATNIDNFYYSITTYTHYSANTELSNYLNDLC